MKRVLSRDEQRIQHTRKIEFAFRMELLLHGLVTDILAGDISRLVEFQQLIQYATPEMKDRIKDMLNKRG